MLTFYQLLTLNLALYAPINGPTFIKRIVSRLTPFSEILIRVNILALETPPRDCTPH